MGLSETLLCSAELDTPEETSALDLLGPSCSNKAAATAASSANSYGLRCAVLAPVDLGRALFRSPGDEPEGS